LNCDEVARTDAAVAVDIYVHPDRCVARQRREAEVDRGEKVFPLTHRALGSCKCDRGGVREAHISNLNMHWRAAGWLIRSFRDDLNDDDHSTQSTFGITLRRT
jgi:hypothetical protein